MTRTVLITTATAPPKDVPFMQMTNIAARYVTAKAAVYFWAAQGIEKIVLADATSHRLLNDEELILLQQMNVAVEQIHYQQNDEQIKLRGKGFGEGLLIKFALDHSEFLKEETQFFKCTGKIYCRNFEAIWQMIKQNNVTDMFWQYHWEGDALRPWVDLRFFYTTKEFCSQYLIPAYFKSNDRTMEIAEHFCFELLNEKLSNAKALRPLLSGFAGYTGKQYFDLSLGELDTCYPCWVNQ